jgi:hypothetical protein
VIWRDMLRRFQVPLATALYAESGQSRLELDMLDADSVRARRTALFGACSAAAELVATPTPGPHTGPVWVDLERARSCFTRAIEHPESCSDLLPVFRPTAFLFEENLRGRGSHYFCLADDAAPPSIFTGLAAVASIATASIRSLGETYFVPPVPRRDGPAREAWIHAMGLDPPRHGEPGGPFWRLGRHGLWRLDVLAWNEILVLAALIGTNAREAVVVAPRHLLPQIGFVAEIARQMQRTLIGVPLEACPRPTRGMLRDLRRIDRSTEMSLFWHLESEEGGLLTDDPPAILRRRVRR